MLGRTYSPNFMFNFAALLKIRGILGPRETCSIPRFEKGSFLWNVGVPHQLEKQQISEFSTKIQFSVSVCGFD